MKPHITTLTLTAFKGLHGTYHFEPLNIISGPNFSGKTSILQAITVAALGHLPELGKTNPATFGLSSGTTMQIQLDSGAGSIMRSWRQAGKVIKPTAAGDPPPITAYMNAGDFIAATPTNRLRMLARYSDGSMTEVEECLTAMAKAYNLTLTGETVMERTESAVAAMKEKLSTARARKDQFEQMIAGGIELAETPPEQPGPFDRNAVLAAIREEAGANLHAGRTENDYHNILEAESRLLNGQRSGEWPTEEPASAAELIRRRDDNAALISRLQQECTRLQGERGKATRWVNHRHTVDPEEMRQARAITQSIGDLNNIRFTIQKELTKAQVDGGIVEQNWLKATQAINKIETMECCPTCKAAGAGWREAVLSENIAQRDQAEKDRQLFAAQKKNAEDRLRPIEEKIRLLTHLPGWIQSEEREALRLAGEKETAEFDHLLTVNQQELNAAFEESDEITDLLSTAAGHAEKWHAARKLREQVAGKAEAEEAHRRALDVHAAALAALSAAQTAAANHEALTTLWQDWQRREADLTNARAEADKEKDRISLLTANIKTLEETSNEALRKLYDPVLAVARKFSDGILRSPLELHPTTGQIGRYAEEKFVPIALLSGAEQMIAVTCLQVALAKSGEIRIALLDEIGRMEAKVKDAFMSRLEEATAAGEIDQVIIVDHTPTPRPGWNLITLA